MPRRNTGSASGLMLATFLLIFMVCTVGAMLYKRWLPPVMSLHGAGVDRMIMYIICAAGFIFIVGHLVLSKFIVSYGGTAGATYKPMSHRAELFFTFGPVVLIIAVSELGVLVIGAPVWHEVYTQQPDDMVIEITAKQYEWTARYPGKDGKFGARDIKQYDDVENVLALDKHDKAAKDDIVSRGLLVLPAGKGVWFNIRSWDVLHSFNIPVFRTKQDAVPGIFTHTRVVATSVGTAEIACAQICSAGHYTMHAKVLVKSPEDFAKWLSQQTGQFE
jgi:cytochrome c oxidase subunit 2